jgi:hypothetical protein
MYQAHERRTRTNAHTAEDVMVLPCDFTVVCHDSKTKKSNRQSFFNFQENLDEGK